MLNLSLLNPLNYAHVGSYIVPIGKDLILPPRVELSDTMMIRWTINHLAKDVDFLQLNSGLLISEIEITGYGIIESATFDIPPSNFQTKRVQLVNLDLQVPQRLMFRSPSIGVLNSVLEFYAYTGEDEQVYNTYRTDYMPSNNPVSFNTSDLTAAFTQALTSTAASQAAATATAINNSNRTGVVTATSVNILPWSGNIANHAIIATNANRLQTHLNHTGKNGTATSNSRVYLAVGTSTNKDNNKFDYYLDPLGDFATSNEEDTLSIFAWVDAGKTPVTLAINELLPAPTIP